MRRRFARRHAAAAVAVAAAIAGAASAQSPGSRQTREFVQAASQSDTFEIMEAETALAQSSNPQVRDFAQQMIRDHQQLRQAMLDAVARSRLAPPNPGISGDQSMLLGALQSLRGKDFDQAYFKHQALAHHAALVTEQGYARDGDQAIVKQAAAAAVPTIGRHLDMAERMASQ